MTDRQKEIERLGARLSPSVRGWVDNVIVPALLKEWLSREESVNRLADRPTAVTQFEPGKKASAEVVA